MACEGSSKIPLVVIAGPTASGKTALAVQLAAQVGGEVISADSMQIYREMDIATAKPTPAETENIPHHLIDIVSPDENFSLGKYALLAHEKIKEVRGRGKLPLLVGGTGLYVDTVVNNIELSDTPADAALRARLMQRAKEGEAQALYDELAKIDPSSASKLHVNDVKRVVRALEIYYISGETKTLGDEKSKKGRKIYNYLYFAIETEREILYNRINMRVDKMICDGMFNEGAALFKKYGSARTTAMQGIGYREMGMYFRGLTTYDETVSLIKRNSRRLAKRQLTWFSRNSEIIRVKADDTQRCVELIREKFGAEGEVGQ